MLLAKRDGAALRVTLNRPEVRNAFDEDVIAAVTQVFRAAALQKDLRAVVVRGAGKDFCAGADVRWMKRAAGYGPARNKKDALRLAAMCRAIDDCPVPVLAGVQGSCFGGGLGIVAACDVVAAAENAVLSFSECRLGILPAVVSSFVLPKIGPAQARRYFLTAETFGAAAAQRIGLVHEVAPEAELDAKLEGLLAWVLRGGPQAVREAKALIRRAAPLPLERRIPLTVATLARVRSSPEGKEGLSAFLEKRPAAWVPAKGP
ncbi:MAG: enoyl-CoA hydratase/isomerase family protein [Elusimicrobia bacterium]|nr:enoyl-CoA hydratase/isomerase family protein [Elusimicrobiota bacterium]